MTLQEKADCLIIYHSLRSATVGTHHFNTSESSIRTIVKKKKEEKEICEVVVAAIPAGMKTLHFLHNTFLSLLCGYRIAVRKGYLRTQI